MVRRRGLHVICILTFFDSFEDAEECASRVLEHDPTSVKARYRRGQARYALKRFRGAMLGLWP